MDEELIARLGVDAKAVRSGVDQALTALGELESRGGQAVAGFVSKTSKPLLELNQALGTVSSRSTATGRAMAEQSSAFTRLEGSIKRASTAYTTYLRNQATGVGPAGKGLQGYSLSQLDQMQATMRAAAPTGGISGVSSAFTAALKKEIDSRRAVNAQMITDDERFQKQLADEKIAAAERTDTELAQRLKAGIAERRALQEQEARETAALAARTEGTTVATAPYAQRFATGRQTASGAYYGMPAQGGLISSINNVATGRNSAAGNIQNPLQLRNAQEGASQQTLADMRSYYTELERTSAASGTAAAAGGKYNATLNDSSHSLPRLRYALYDVSFALAIGGAALTAAGGAAFKTATEYQALFASVQRTSGLNMDTSQGRQQINALRQDLVGLTTQIPVTFQDVTTIATLAGQLGIASEQIAPFTKVVAEFAATTNVTVDAAATAFGRLGQILHDTNYRAMGDEIAYLGVKSVATESQIIGVAQQIAVSTEQAGFSTKATLALSTTLASLGIKAEASRGSMIRFFGTVSAAVTDGGKGLNDLAAISGMSAAAFQKAWRQDSSKAFLAFVDGLSKSSSSVKANLADLHITAARDVQTFALLAQNTDLLNKSFRQAGEASGYLDKAFATQTNTVAGRMTLLQNTIKATLDEIGNSATGPLTVALNVLIKLVSYFDRLASNPVEAWALAAASGLTVLLGVVALIIGGGLRITASYLALQQAFRDTEVQSNGLVGAYARLIGVTKEQTVANGELVASTEAVDAAMAGEAVAATETEAAVTKLSLATKIGLAGAILLGITLLPAFIQWLDDTGKSMQGLNPDVDTLTKKILGLTDATTKAADLSDLKKALPTYNKTQGGIGQGGILGLFESMSSQNYQVQRPNGSSYTTNATQGAINSINKGQSTPGGSIPLLGGSMFFDKGVSDATQQIQNFDKAVAGLVTGGHTIAAQQALRLYAAQMKAAGVDSKDANSALVATAAALGVVNGASLTAASGAKAVADAEAQARTEFTNTIQTLFGQGIADQQATADVAALGKAVADTGASSALNGQVIATALASISAASPAPEAAANILGIANALYAAGAASKDQLANMRAAAYALDPTAKANQKFAATVTDSYNAEIAAQQKAAQSAASSAEKTVRTLTDYANDLQSVLSRAFGIRYGDQQALDAVTKGYLDLKNQAKDAATNLAKVRAELLALQATRDVTKYQLGVANEYGDTTRGNVLRGQLAGNNADIASKQKEIASAQDATNKTLVGNSAAAIANRAAVLQQVQAGQSLLTTMAANGATTAQLTAESNKLKKQLVDQFGQMGYNRSQVAALSKGFDDFVTIVHSIPKNVNVNVNAKTHPAEAAIKEFLEKNKHLNVNVGVTPVPNTPRAKNTGTDIAAAVSDGAQAEFNRRYGTFKAPASIAKPTGKGDSPSSSGINIGALAGIVGQVFTKMLGFSSGGYTGDGPASQIAGVVHGREFVLNERATAMFPRQVLDSWNQGHAMSAPNVTTKVNVESGSVLSRDDRMFLAAALTRAPAVAISADQMGRAIDGSYVRAGQRGAN